MLYCNPQIKTYEAPKLAKDLCNVNRTGQEIHSSPRNGRRDLLFLCSQMQAGSLLACAVLRKTYLGHCRKSRSQEHRKWQTAQSLGCANSFPLTEESHSKQTCSLLVLNTAAETARQSHVKQLQSAKSSRSM